MKDVASYNIIASTIVLGGVFISFWGGGGGGGVSFIAGGVGHFLGYRV